MDPDRNITIISGRQDVSANIELSRGSAFVLVTSLLATLIFHPFGGSLIYGPTLRFWIAAPTSMLAELFVIFAYIAKHCIAQFHSRFLYDEDLQDSHRPGLRNKMYHLVAARSMNTFGGSRRQTLYADIRDLPEFIKISVKIINEGWRFRVFILFPLLTQYVKLMAVSGQNTIVLKILGTLCAVHWLVLEMVYLFAQSGDDRELVLQVKKLLPLKDFSDNQTQDNLKDALLEAGESTTIFEPSSHLLHQITAVIGSFAMILCWSRNIAPLLVGSMIPWAWLLWCGLQHDRRAKSVARRIFAQREWKAVRNILPFGGPGVGADIGCIFLVYWILYCVYVYDSAGTSRPQWPWLDWMG